MHRARRPLPTSSRVTRRSRDDARPAPHELSGRARAALHVRGPLIASSASVNARLTLFVLVGALTACVNVPQNGPPAAVIVAEFDPGATIPVVPTPNDLAKNATTGRIVVPVTPGESAAQTEFDQTYLGTLTGFPFESTAQALLSGDLDPSTVTAQTVLAFDLGTNASPSQVPVAIAPTWDAGHRAIVVPPPSGGWTRAHGYALVLVGGPSGLRGAQGQDVVGSETWALVSSSTSLVTCPRPRRAGLQADRRHHPVDPDRSRRSPRRPDGEGDRARATPSPLRAVARRARRRGGLPRAGHPARVDVHRRRRGRGDVRPGEQRHSLPERRAAQQRQR